MFKLNVLLAEAAQVAEGKLFILGGGWSMIVAGGPFAVCGKIDIPWHQGPDWHTLRLELLDADGEPFLVPSEGDEGEPLAVELPPFRPVIGTHVKPGTNLDWPFALNIRPGLPLQPRTFYEWRLSIDGKHEESWSLPFATAPAPEALAA